jgi:hypothetical protein
LRVFGENTKNQQKLLFSKRGTFVIGQRVLKNLRGTPPLQKAVKILGLFGLSFTAFVDSEISGS